MEIVPIVNHPLTGSLQSYRRKVHSYWFANALVLILFALSEPAYAQDIPRALGGITTILKGIANLLIFEWGYYLGIITLAIQFYRWKTGRINLMDLGTWGIAIFGIFFAPNIVQSIRSGSGGTVG